MDVSSLLASIYIVELNPIFKFDMMVDYANYEEIPHRIRPQGFQEQRKDDQEDQEVLFDFQIGPPDLLHGLRHLTGRTNYERVRVVNFNEKTFQLDRMRKLLKKLGNPQDGLRTIHVAGTVGKGSTTSMAANMLKQCGFTVGTFTSPHLVEITEPLRSMACRSVKPTSPHSCVKSFRPPIRSTRQ